MLAKPERIEAFPEDTGSGPGSAGAQTQLSPVTVELAPVLESPCLLSGVFPMQDSIEVIIETYSASGAVSSLTLTDANVNAFTLLTSPNGDAFVTATFDYAAVAWGTTDEDGKGTTDGYIPPIEGP